MNYYEYLASPEWQRQRQLTFRRAGNRCQLCGATDTPLQAHHNTYEHLGNEPPSDLIALCAECHQLFHAHRTLARQAQVQNVDPLIGQRRALIEATLLLLREHPEGLRYNEWTGVRGGGQSDKTVLNSLVSGNPFVCIGTDSFVGTVEKFRVTENKRSVARYSLSTKGRGIADRVAIERGVQ